MLKSYYNNELRRRDKQRDEFWPEAERPVVWFLVFTLQQHDYNCIVTYPRTKVYLDIKTQIFPKSYTKSAESYSKLSIPMQSDPFSRDG